MKNTKRCTKCQSDEIARTESSYPSEVDIPVGFMAAAAVTFYVCCKCGYCEPWIESPESLPKIKKKYVTGSIQKPDTASPPTP